MGRHKIDDGIVRLNICMPASLYAEFKANVTAGVKLSHICQQAVQNKIAELKAQKSDADTGTADAQHVVLTDQELRTVVYTLSEPKLSLVEKLVTLRNIFDKGNKSIAWCEGYFTALRKLSN